MVVEYYIPFMLKKSKGRGKWCHYITILKKKNNLKSWILYLFIFISTGCHHKCCNNYFTSEFVFLSKSKAWLLRCGDGCIIWHLGCASVAWLLSPEAQPRECCWQEAAISKLGSSKYSRSSHSRCLLRSVGSLRVGRWNVLMVFDCTSDSWQSLLMSWQ